MHTGGIPTESLISNSQRKGFYQSDYEGMVHK